MAGKNEIKAGTLVMFRQGNMHLYGEVIQDEEEGFAVCLVQAYHHHHLHLFQVQTDQILHVYSERGQS
ncbi:MAG: hypothetical protein U0K47_04020 [Erysipelotrichaceae bacterium]|nr:hypothetical protein [Erysipelotrichaceae bacterium]MEE1333741.1 hypothetical protein [Erysipelotrichaceae bacterium]